MRKSIRILTIAALMLAMVFSGFAQSNTAKMLETHVTSTSAEIQWIGDNGKLIVYYNGYDIATNPPTGKITSYGKPYPGTRYKVKLFNGVVNDPIFGTTLTKVFAPGDAKTFVLKAGDSYSYNANTNTITYNRNKPVEIWGEGVELPDNGKQWTAESFYTVENGIIKPKYTAN